MRDIVRHVLAGMTADERVEAAEELRRMVAADRAAAADREVGRCPRCGCPVVVRRGRDGRGRQRWLRRC